MEPEKPFWKAPYGVSKVRTKNGPGYRLSWGLRQGLSAFSVRNHVGGLPSQY